MVPVRFRWFPPGLGPATDIALIYDIVLKEINEQALGRKCHICPISLAEAGAYRTTRSPIDSTCHTK